MNALDDDDLRRLRSRLETREAQLREEVRALDAESSDTPGGTAQGQVEDIGEQGEGRIRGAVRHAERECDIDELRAIAAAQERQPAAMRCLPCQERFERSHRVGARIPPVI